MKIIKKNVPIILFSILPISIIIGSSASGLKDSVVTPLQSNIIGSEIHAQYIENIINNDFLYRPDYAYGLEISLTLTLSLIVIIIIFFNSALISTISSLEIEIDFNPFSASFFAITIFSFSPLDKTFLSFFASIKSNDSFIGLLKFSGLKSVDQFFFSKL